VLALLAAVDDPATRRAVVTERAFLATLGSGCTLPVGAYATADELHGFLADPDAGRSLRRVVSLRDGEELAQAAALALELRRAVDDG
jgi:hydroxymethylbilane synthase